MAEAKKEFETEVRSKYDNRKDVEIRSLMMPTWRARLATALIEKWGMVACEIAGEDSAGRTSLRLLTPKEVVDRAIETADTAVNAFEELGWIFELPNAQEAQQMIDEKEAKVSY